MTLALVANHLWESTLVAVVAALVVRTIDPRRAALRHGIWLAASVKFLLPLSVLTAIGAAAGVWLPPLRVAAAAGSADVTGASAQRFAAEAMAAEPGSGAAMLVLALAAIWIAGAMTVAAIRVRQVIVVRRLAGTGRALIDGEERVALAHALERAGVARPVGIAELPIAGAPALVGWRRLIVLWPRGLSARLTRDQLDAVMLHEATHVRRRDNLVGLLHTFVETLLWFHPLVWWIGARLEAERERACDIAVLRSGIPADAYADGLLRVGRFCLSLPQPALPAATRWTLAARVEAIMSYRHLPGFGPRSRLLLGIAGINLLAVPLVAGALQARPVVQDVRPVEPEIAVVQAPSVVPTPPAPVVAPQPTPDVRPAPVPTPAPSPSPVVAVIAPAPLPVVTPPVPGPSPVVTPVVPAPLPAATPVVPAPLPAATAVVPAAPKAPAAPTPAMPALPMQDRTRGPKVASRGPDGVSFDTAEPNVEAFRDNAVSANPADTPNLVAPIVRLSFRPTYTPRAMQERAQGTAKVEVVVLPDGTVQRARIVEGVHPELDAEALRAALAWTFTPARVNGTPVKSYVELELTFVLRG